MVKGTTIPKDFYTLLGGIFSLLAVGIITAGYFVYRGYAKQHRVEVLRKLEAIASLKTADLVHWRSERLREAKIISYTGSNSGLVSGFLKKTGEREAENLLREWMKHYLDGRDCDQVRLFDAQGDPRLTLPVGGAPPSAIVRKGVAQVLVTGQIEMVDFYRQDDDQKIYLSYLVPIFDGPGAKRTVGVLALRINPGKFIYPSILHLPSPSATMETLLVRRDGQDVLFLSDLRFAKGAALELRLPLTKIDTPPVMAVLGRRGSVEGVDYRGQPVIASLAAVADSPWFLVVRINTAEVYASARKQLWLIAGWVLFVLMVTGVGLALFWRQQHMRFYEERYRVAEELRLHSEIMRNMAEGVFLVRMADGTIVYANPCLERMFGYGPGELVGQDVAIVNAPNQKTPKETKEAIIAILAATGEWRGEVENLRKDGTRFWSQANVSVFDHRQYGKVMVAVRTDITERKQVEEQLSASLREKTVLLQEIHHRVKNNLQVVYSLLSLQAKGVVDPLTRIKFEESRNRVMAMALIHEKLYQAQDLASIEIKDYLQSLIADLAATYNRPEVAVVVDMAPLAMGVTVAIPCGLIINELVSNSFKHGFPGGRGGEIRLGIDRAGEDNLILTVADNGVGFPVGVDFRDTSSLGLQIVNVLVGQIHGTIELHPAGGAEFRVVFPALAGKKRGGNG